MVLFTHKKLILKGSKKQYQILAQTAYYQAGKIVVQTILPEQSPVALITLNTFGTTCSTSADTYIPIENISNTQSCFFLESRLVSLYGGKAASLLIEYHQRFTSFYPHDQPSTLGKPSIHFTGNAKQSSWQGKKGAFTPVPASQSQLSGLAYTRRSGASEQRRDKGSLFSTHYQYPANASLVKALQASLVQQGKPVRSEMIQDPGGVRHVPLQGKTALLEKQRRGEESETGITYNTEIKLIDNVQNRVFDTSDFTLFQNKKLRAKGLRSRAPLVKTKTYFAGAGNNPFQSTLGNIEIQTATRLAKIMVNYWNFYLLNKNSLYSLFKRYAHPHYLPSTHIALQTRRFFRGSHAPLNGVAQRGRARRFASHYPSALQVQYKRSSIAYLEGVKGYGGVLQSRGLPFTNKALHANSLSRPASTAESVVGNGIQDMQSKEAEGYTKYKCNVSVCSIKLHIKDQTFQGKIIYRVENNLYLAIAQSKNSLKICENKNSSYNIQRLSVENIGNYSQLNTNNFQLINSLQFSNLQRDHFYPNWFRLYLPDIEASEFLKNVANYYFSLGLQTLTLPSTKSSPFLTFLNKNPQREKYKLFIPNILSCTYCPPSILVNSTSDKSIHSSPSLPLYPIRAKQRNGKGVCEMKGKAYAKESSWGSSFASKGVMEVKDPSFIKIAKNHVPFSLLVENQIFPLNHNGFSIVEKELLYNALINSCFAKAFYLINQNRQMLDFFVDYLLRFQILRQHQILYLFSTLLLGCYKKV